MDRDAPIPVVAGTLGHALGLYAGCLAAGYGPSARNAEQVAGWARDAGVGGVPSVVVGYLLDDDLAEKPGVLYYSADIESETVPQVPTPEELRAQDLDGLQLLAGAALLVALVADTSPTPFDDATVTALDRHPAPDENPRLWEVDGIGPEIEFRLRKADIRTTADLARLDADNLQAVKGVGPSTAETIVDGMPPEA